MTDTAVRADETASAHPAHPLDPATAAEYLAGREIIAAAGLLADPTRFAYYGLEEPPKDDVLAGPDPKTAVAGEDLADHQHRA
jgi:Cu2+-containing amine oxidase